MGAGSAAAKPTRQPALYIPHGGGPCFFMDWPAGRNPWESLGEWLRGELQAAIGRHSRALSKRFRPAMFSHNGASIAGAAAIFAVTLVMTLLLATASGGGLPWAFAPLGLGLLVLVGFGLVVGAPTPEGRRLLDEIEGFKRYLSVAERDDLARLEGPGAPPVLEDLLLGDVPAAEVEGTVTSVGLSRWKAMRMLSAYRR